MSSTTKPSYILVADNQRFFRQGVKALVSSEPDLRVIDEATDITDLIVKVQLLRPDVVVLDMSLNGPVTGDTIQAIHVAYAGVSVLLLTKDDGPGTLQLAKQMGVRGCMPRSSSPAQLVKALRRLCSGEEFSRMDEDTQTLNDLRALARTTEARPSPTALTSREREVMKLLAEGATARKVSAVLGLSIKTVEAHKLNFMRKLDIHHRSQLVDFAIASGLVETVSV